MKFRVERNDLTEAVAWTARSLPARPTIPALSCILLDADSSGGSDVLRLSGFDYEVAAHATLDVSTQTPGRALVSGRLLADITRALPAAPVELSLEGTRLTLVCGSSKFTLPTLPVEDYPSLPELPSLAGHIASNALATAVGQVAIAAGKDDTLPVLTGIRLEIHGDSLTLAATDRYRLAVRQLAWRPSPDVEDVNTLVPARTLSEAAKAFASSGAEVALHLGRGAQGEGMAGFESGSRRTTTRLIDGEFPKYHALIPDSSEALAEVSTLALSEAVKRVALVAARTAPVKLKFSDGQIELHAGTGDEPTASEVIEASFTGDELTIAFNPGYLLDGLGAIDSDTAQLAFTSATKPAVITGKQGDDVTAEYRYLLMPVRLNG